MDFGIEAPAPQPVGSAVSGLQTTISSGLRTAVRTVASLVSLPVRLPLRGLVGVLRLIQDIGLTAIQSWSSRPSRTARTLEQPSAPSAEPARPATAAPQEPVIEQVYEEPVQAPRTPRANPFAAVGRLVGAPIAFGYRKLSTAAYLISLPLLAVMVLLLVVEAARVGVGLGQFPVIIIAIGAGLVFIFTRIRRTRSGNIRRAERAAEALDEDRA